MIIRENEPLKGKTTMRIGGNARWYTELKTKEDVEEAVTFAEEQEIPLIILGGGSNTIFADGTINALVARITAENVLHQQTNQPINQSTVAVEVGKNLPMLVNELAAKGLDLSALTGILGTAGGAVFGNAGQGPKGIWIDTFVKSVRIYANKTWRTLKKEDCEFSYRESIFKRFDPAPIIWNVTLEVPRKDPAEIKAEIESLLKKRIETQPHIKTAGSCFKAIGGTPAWQLIDAAGFRGVKAGGVRISEKHANFLINEGDGTFDDAVRIVEDVKKGIPDHLEVEMRFIQENGDTIKW